MNKKTILLEDNKASQYIISISNIMCIVKTQTAIVVWFNSLNSKKFPATNHNITEFDSIENPVYNELQVPKFK
jgi:hypothetical protein